jgi:hypothetical protein
MQTPKTFISTRTKKVAAETSTPIVEQKVEIELADESLEVIPLPSSVRIGPFEHSIRPMGLVKSVSMNRIGEYDTLNLAIEILEEMPAARRAETLLHELFHGLWHVSGLRNDIDEDEEHAVTVLSLAMAGLIRDNPELVAYLVQNLGGEG